MKMKLDFIKYTFDETYPLDILIIHKNKKNIV